MTFHDLVLGRRRRAAPLRRAPAPGDHRQGRRARHAGDDRDADPAHAGADRLRRHGRLAAHRKAGRPPADPAPSRCRSTGSTSWSSASRDAIAEGQKVYWICPLVEESEEIKLMSAEDRFAIAAADLRRRGRPRPRPHEAARDKDEAMRAFKAGETRILVAHDGHRGRRRRAGRDDHGDRARRALRPGAAAPAARPRRARRQAVDPACCSTRRRSARPRSDGCR